MTSKDKSVRSNEVLAFLISAILLFCFKSTASYPALSVSRYLIFPLTSISTPSIISVLERDRIFLIRLKPNGF